MSEQGDQRAVVDDPTLGILSDHSSLHAVVKDLRRCPAFLDVRAKDTLPLLAFTLERLYEEYHQAGRLKLEHYEKLGRIKGSIEAAIARVFKAADADARISSDNQTRLALLRRGLIPWLADIDPETGAPRRRVARLSEIPGEARPLIDLLVEQRLLSTDVSKETGETTIEPAHEALLRQWGLLQGWLAEDVGLLTVLDGIKRASRDWAANAKAMPWLAHAGERLKAADMLIGRADLAANLEPTDYDYLAACRAAELAAAEKERRAARARRRMQAAVMTLMAVTILGLVSLIKKDLALAQAINVKPRVVDPLCHPPNGIDVEN